MTTGDFPPALLRLIRASVPTFPAAELLVFMYRNPSRRWTVEAIGQAIQPAVILPPAIKEYLALFVRQGLVAESSGEFEYVATGPAGDAVGELARAYNERPVTLIRTIYSIADHAIQSFADAFRLRPKEEQE